MDNKTKAIIAIILWAAIGGAISPITKIALVKIPPFTFSFLRFAVASVAIAPLFLKQKPKLNKDLLYLIILSFLPVLNVAFFVSGVKLTTASISQMLYGGVPLLTGIFSCFILKNKVSSKTWLFISIGLIGVLEVIMLPVLQKESFSGDLTGNILVLTAVVIWSLYMVLSKQIQRTFNPIVITSVFIFLATFIFFILAMTETSFNNELFLTLQSSAIIGIIYVGLLATVGGYVLNQYAIKFGGPLIASLSFYLSPIFGYIFSFILLGEKLTTGLIIGTILVFISVTLTTYSK